MTGLSRDEVARFRRDGALFPLRVLDPDEIGACLRRLQRLEAERAGRLSPALNAKAHLLLPWLWDMVHDVRILDAVEALLGPDLLCWGTSFIIKRPGESRYVAWHQDATYWGLSSPRAVTAWVAFTPSTRDNGCVRVIRGSHKAILPHVNSRDPDNLLGLRERTADRVDESRAIDLELAPGEMSLHDVLVVHGSEPNRSEAPRIGFAIRYIPSDVGQVVGERNSATLVRGREHGHFDLEQRPESEFCPLALARHADILRRGMSVLFSAARRDGER